MEQNENGSLIFEEIEESMQKESLNGLVASLLKSSGRTLYTSEVNCISQLKGKRLSLRENHGNISKYGEFRTRLLYLDIGRLTWCKQ